MNNRKLIFRSLHFYRRTNLGVLIGTVIATAVLAGALIVGDSVRYSLNRIALIRLGRTEFALSSRDRFFRSALADDLSKKVGTDSAPVLRLNGIAVGERTQNRVNRIQVLGVDQRFWSIGQTTDILSNMAEDEAVINTKLASRLELHPGDEFLLRIEKANILPGDVPFSSRETGTVALRLKVRAIASDRQFGRFGLESSQISPNTVFLHNSFLSQKMELQGRANILLVAEQTGSGVSSQMLDSTLASVWKLPDAELQIRDNLNIEGKELVSDRVFLDPPVVDAAFKLKTDKRGILTYFVNTIGKGKRQTPYSFISAPGSPLIPDDMDDDEIIINEWVSKDIRAAAGDSIYLTYLVPGADRKLEERRYRFRVQAVVEMRGQAADGSLMPMFPGLSDADNCRDWDPGIPIDLKKIRNKDETYWDSYKGTPKGFVTLNRAKQLWANRFGALTAIRFYKKNDPLIDLGKNIMHLLTPQSLGMTFRPVREEAIQAGSEAVDFGQLFLGLSFNIIIAALLLTGLLFVLSAEQRAKETGILLALGYTQAQVRRCLLAEGLILAIIGGLLGTASGILYNKVVLYFLGTLWRGAVGTSTLVVHVKGTTLVLGFIIGAGMAVLAMALALRKQVKKPILELKRGQSPGSEVTGYKTPRISIGLTFFCFIGVLIIFIIVSPGKDREAAAAFWAGGFLMLTGSLALCNVLLQRLKHSESKTTLTASGLGRRNTIRKKGRSLSTIALLSFGIFIAIAVGANRKDFISNSDIRSSGTGGFAFFGETSMPVYHDLNSKENWPKFGLTDIGSPDIKFVSMRVREGDDASCLNLNRTKNPRILGLKPEELGSRKAFTFVKTVEGVEIDNCWLGLNQTLDDNVIPAIADETVIVWGLGKSVGDTLTYVNERGKSLKLRLIGSLASSIFQGNILISEKNFIKHYPTISGTRVMLIDVPEENRIDVLNILSRTMQDYGLDIDPAAERLAEFDAVSNTYLSIFLALGGLGLILGTVGMGIIIFRNVMERRGELALLRAVGFDRKVVRRMLLSENNLLLTTGIFCGTFSAIIAVLPALLSPGADIPYFFLLGTLGIIIISSWIWTFLSTMAATRGDLTPSLRDE